jgi:2-polyprenyl-3-methyl-5-hydroxy-6-metoxy-1,4-benzoquinol methylase
MNLSRCRSCNAELNRTFIDLGYSPLANSFLSAAEQRRMQRFYPLHAFVCENCLLVQLEIYETAEQIFDHYLYFSSYSELGLEHSRRYAAQMVRQRHLGAQSLVVEVASNDGYLLQYFAEHGVGVLGIEPAANVAAVALGKGIRTEIAYFGAATAERLVREVGRADLMVANNVLAHVPALNDFVAGFRIMLKPEGRATFEFPHLQRLIAGCQFDTIYHEHFSYFSLLVVDAIFARHGLTIFDVEELATHGGSLRVYAAHADAAPPRSAGWHKVIAAEKAFGLDRLDGYAGFAEAVTAVKCRLLEFLIGAWREGKTVVGYGAPAKGNTLLNYCGVGRELIPYTVDRSPHKQGRFLPGVQIPIYAPERIFETKPDYVLILPWNIQAEIRRKMAAIREWGCRFVVAVPSIAVLD